MPVWPGDPPVQRTSVARRDRDGYNLHELRLGEHAGTHLGAPAHFVAQGRMVHEIPPDDLVRPAVVLDLRREAAEDADLEVRPGHVEAWEAEHGRVPAGAVVLLMTGWSRRWPNQAAFLGTDETGAMHFPGFGSAAARLLIQDRGAVGLGTDTPGIDPGHDRTFAANRVVLGAGRYHLECLHNLDQLPPTGALLVVGALKIAGGSGSPARVLALL